MRVAGSLTHIFHAQADAASIQIYGDYFHRHHIPHADYLEGVLHVAVGHLADVDQAILLDADVDEGAEVDDVAQITNAMGLSSHL
jgi:hypothetical protein